MKLLSMIVFSRSYHSSLIILYIIYLLQLQQEEVIKLEGQKLELVTIIHNKKGELLQLAGEVERNQNILSGLNTDTTKQKEAFQQITEQYKTSQSELSILKMQQEKKVEILENTSRHLQKVCIVKWLFCL